MKKVALILFFCSLAIAQNNGSFKDERDGKTYKQVKIGKQIWMAQNLNYVVDSSWCYDDDQANCDKYGRLYDWTTAMGLPSSCDSASCANQIKSKHKGICPTGYHIPNNDDWSKLKKVGGSSVGRKLKATDGWNSGDNGTDSYGFSALPGGYRDSVGNFRSAGEGGWWWSASEKNSVGSHYWIMASGSERFGWFSYYKSDGYSVRCLQN